MAQGGFFCTSYMVCGVVVALAIAFNNKKASCCKDMCQCKEIWLLAVIAAIYIVSMIAHGISFVEFSNAFLPLVCLCFGIYFLCVEEVKKEKYLDVFCVIGTFSAFLGIIIFLLGNEKFGMMNQNRLQFTFQYANAAGAWFGVFAILCMGAQKKSLKYMSVVNIIALLLTKSVGAMGMFAIYCAMNGLISVLRGKKSESEENSRNDNGKSKNNKNSNHRKNQNANENSIMIAVRILGVIGVVLGGIYVLTSRFEQAKYTFIERLIQSEDGLKVIAKFPLFGIGPGRWSEVYPFYQSAQYKAAVIHNSFVQIGVDAGVIALVASLLLFAIVVRNYIKNATSVTGAALYIMLHSLMDYDLRFLAIDILLVFLVAMNCKKETVDDKRTEAAEIITIIMAVAFAVLFVVCRVCTSKEELFKKREEKTYIGELQKFEQTIETEEYSVDAAIKLIEEQPYNCNLIERVTRIVESQNQNEDEIEKYNEAIDRVNKKLKQGNSRLLNNQKKMKKIR